VTGKWNRYTSTSGEVRYVLVFPEIHPGSASFPLLDSQSIIMAPGHKLGVDCELKCRKLRSYNRGIRNREYRALSDHEKKSIPLHCQNGSPEKVSSH